MPIRAREMINAKALDKFEELIADLKVDNRRLFLIGVDGRPCSGKSTLTDNLMEKLGAEALFFDDFFIPQAAWPKDIKPALPFPYIRDAEFVQGVKKLSQGLAFQYQPFDWHSQKLGNTKVIKPNGIIIVEGVSVIREEIVSCFHKKILVVSNIDNEFEAICEREKNIGISNWKQLFLPSVELYWKTKPWERADILYAGRGITNKRRILPSLTKAYP